MSTLLCIFGLQVLTMKSIFFLFGMLLSAPLALSAQQERKPDTLDFYSFFDPQRQREFLNMGFDNLRMGEHEKSIYIFNSLSQSTYRNESYYGLAVIACSEGKYESALETLQKCDGKSDFPEKHLIKGMCLYHIGKERDAAEAVLSEAISKDEGMVLAYYYRALNRIMSDDERGAVRDLSLATEIDSNFAEAWYAKAYLYYLSQQWESAYPNIRKAIEIDSGNTAYRLMLGSVAYASGHQEEAIENLLACTHDSSTELYAKSELAIIHQSEGKYKEACRMWQELIIVYPDEAYLHSNLASCQIKQGRLSIAEDAFDQAISLSPEQGQFYYNRAVCLELQGRYREACDDWIKAAERGIKAAESIVIKKCN